MKIQSLIACLLLASVSYANDKEKKLANLELNKLNYSVLNTYGNPNDIEIEINDNNLLVFDSSFGKVYSTPTNNEIVKYIYNRTGHQITVLFNTNNVDAIVLSGVKSPFKTIKNIELGSKYSEVVKSYGNPNYIVQTGNVIILNYKENLKFQFKKSNTIPQQEWIVSQISIHSN